MEREVSSTKQFMVLRGGRQVGPLKAAELQSRAREGAISPLDSVCAVGSDKWVLGYQVKGLFPAWLAAEIKERLVKGEGIDDLFQASPSSRQESSEGERVVMLVVDGDGTPTSRRFIDGIGSGDSVDVIAVQDADSARQMARSGQGHALLIVGEGFEEGIWSGNAISVAVEEYAPELLREKSISLQSLIGQSSKLLRPAKTSVAVIAPSLLRGEGHHQRPQRHEREVFQPDDTIGFGAILQTLWFLIAELPLILLKLIVGLALIAIGLFFLYLTF